jgi:hypothetical protein
MAKIEAAFTLGLVLGLASAAALQQRAFDLRATSLQVVHATKGDRPGVR